MAALDLITVTEYKDAYNVSGTAKNGEIVAAITAASEAILAEVERELVKPGDTPATRRFELLPDRGERGTWVVDLTPYDARTITAATLHPESTAPVTLDPSQWRLTPANPRHGVYTAVELAATVNPAGDTLTRFGVCLVDLTGTWGFAEVPAAAKRACIETVRAWVRNDPQGWSHAVDDPRPEGAVIQGTRHIPMSALRLLDPLRRYTSIA
ncbi:MAG: hypothetical protein AB1416_12035 [Actinomycetota bacterium]